MSRKKQEKASAILLSLAEYRFLSVEQLAALNFSSLQMARKARNELDRAGLVDTIHSGYGGGKGRPGFLLSLSRSGIDRLVMVLAGVDAIRDVILFPQLKPKE